ncbi:MAG: NAD(+)/NADH kinase [Lachnospiraceae bacterium]|nr:NAD(+)/NADH kinase [Lachnospiraceae bacterium]
MKNYCIIANSSKDIEYELSEKIRDYLVKKGAKCYVDKSISSDKKYRFTNPDVLPEDIECIITIGGDGTLLQAAHDLIEKNVVFLGINKGNLGFLAQNCNTEIYRILDRLIDDDYKIEERMMLKGIVKRNGEVIYENVALNDIVIHRYGGISISDYKVYVNDLFLNEYNADGLICATPTGSTAYSLSAGGPIVEPNAGLIVLTPICAHSINGRSIIFSDKDMISVIIKEPRYLKNEKDLVAFDGYAEMVLEPDDVIIINKANLCTKLVKLDDSSFLQVLKDKMGEK